MLIKQERVFKDREELDAYVRSTYGDNAEKNKELTLELTQDEMTKFLLSEKTTVFGAKISKKVN